MVQDKNNCNKTIAAELPTLLQDPSSLVGSVFAPFLTFSMDIFSTGELIGEDLWAKKKEKTHEN